MRKEEFVAMLVTMLMCTAVLIGYIYSFIYFDRLAELNSVKNLIRLVISWFSASTIFSSFCLELFHRKEDVKEEP